MYPHCDSRIVHRPSTCKYCDMHPELQQARAAAGINFTGEFFPDLLACPADASRPPGEKGDHRRWPGNQRRNNEAL